MLKLINSVSEIVKIAYVFLILFVGSSAILYLLAYVFPPILNLSYYLIVYILIIQAALSYWYTTRVFSVDSVIPAHSCASTAVVKTTFIVAAYLPNELEVIEDTLRNILFNVVRPAAGIEVILAYNTPNMDPFELRLRDMALANPELILANAYNSRSKSENLNYSLDLASGEIIVILDADHRVAADCLSKAWRWLDSGYDVVQGRCKIRNGHKSFISGLVEVEFDIIYGIQHAAKSAIFDTSLFGGSNGYWKSEVIKKVRFQDTMLTEDIDGTIRGILAGYRFVHDRTLVSTELAPTTIKGLWFQRKRWSQGWFQCSMKYQMAMWLTPHLTAAQKFLWTTLLSWRVFYDVVTTLLFPVLFSFWFHQGEIYLPINSFIVFSLIVTLLSGPYQCIAAYRNATLPRAPVFLYLLYACFVWPYTIFKTIVHMVGIYDELSGIHSWVVSKRGM